MNENKQDNDTVQEEDIEVIRPKDEEETEAAGADTPDSKDTEIKNLSGQLLRLRAEFDNYRRRVEKEKELRFTYGKQSVLLKLLDLIDIFDNAVKHAHDAQQIKDVVNGIHLIHKEFLSFINKEGVQPVESIGRIFDHNYHEIIGFEENDQEEENMILHEAQKGYLCGDDVIRPAKVIVAKKKEEKKDKKKESKA